jgi:hypothetical protein
MKLFDFNVIEDYGTDVYLIFLQTKRYNLLQISFRYCEYASWPYMQITVGQNKLLGFFCYFWKFGFDIDILERTWES